MFARALLAFLALPGVVAFAVPASIVFGSGWDAAFAGARPAGLVPFAAGVLILLRCVRDFYVTGRGTLAPWDPPRRLVTVGLYRWSRNPMYVGVVLILIGWAAIFPRPALAIYAVFVFILFHLRVLLNEEPFLARTHGAEWDRYRSRVPRWLGPVAHYSFHVVETSGRSRDLVYEEDGRRLVIYLEMSGVPEFDWLGSDREFERWTEPKGEPIDEARRGEIRARVDRWAKANRWRLDFSPPIPR